MEYIIFIALNISFISIWFVYFNNISIFNKNNWTFQLGSILLGFSTYYLLRIIKVLPIFETEYLILEEGIFSDFLNAFIDISLYEVIYLSLVFLIYTAVIKNKIDVFDFVKIGCGLGLGYILTDNYNHFITHFKHENYFEFVEHLHFSLVYMFAFSLVGYGIGSFYHSKSAKQLAKCILLAWLYISVFNYVSKHLDISLYFTIILYYIIISFGISFMIQSISNALNLSKNIEKHNIINYPKVMKEFTRTTIIYYIFAFILLFTFYGNVYSGFMITFLTLLFHLPILFVTYMRVSKIHIQEHLIRPIKVSLPFKIKYINDAKSVLDTAVFDEDDGGGLSSYFAIGGKAYQEIVLSKFLNKKVILAPISKRRGYFKKKIQVTVNDRFDLKGQQLAYSIQFDEDIEGVTHLLIAKQSGDKWVNDKYPIYGLYKYEHTDIEFSKGVFIEWMSARIQK